MTMNRDDVSDEVKNRRLSQVISLFYETSKKENEKEIGREHLVLVEGKSRRSDNQWVGRSDTNKKVVLECIQVKDRLHDNNVMRDIVPGDFVIVKITSFTSATLRGTPTAISSISDFEKYNIEYRSGTQPMMKEESNIIREINASI